MVPFHYYLKWEEEGLTFDKMLARWQNSSEFNIKYLRLLREVEE